MSGGEEWCDENAEGARGGGDGLQCCRDTEQRIRVELEGKLVALEVKIDANQKEAKAYVDTLMECIQLRDERIIAKDCELKGKEEVISELKEKVDQSNVEIAKLSTDVEELSKQLKVREAEATLQIQRLAEKRSDEQRKRRQKPVFTPVPLETLFRGETFERFFTVELPQDVKRITNPFDLETDLASKIGGLPQSITSSGKDSLLVEVRNKSQSDLMKNVNSICNAHCVTRSYALFNERKGLIYVYNIEEDNVISFCEGLAEEYNLQSVQEAKWIHPKNGGKAFLICTCQDELPAYLKIFGEYSLTKVYPYRDIPRKCKKCLEYGHPEKYCKSTYANCSRCAERHRTADCSLQRDGTCKCYNCGGDHPSGHPSCAVRVKEEKIIDLQKAMKVNRRQAVRILNGENVQDRKSGVYCRYIQISMNATQRRKLCPFKVERFF